MVALNISLFTFSIEISTDSEINEDLRDGGISLGTPVGGLKIYVGSFVSFSMTHC